MIRKLNAVAVAALALVAAAGAQAQSSVSVYGTIDEAIVSLHNSADAQKGAPAAQRLRGLEDGGMTASYLGFAGTEDLGGGLKAKFKLESYLKADTGTTTTGQFWSRNSWLGLAGNFGTVLAGQAETPLYNATTAFNPFGASANFSPAVRQYFGSYGDVKAVGTSGTSNQAWANSLTYYTPGDLGGFNGALQYSFKETATGSGSVGLSGGYAAGPLAVAAVYQQVKTGYATGHQNTWQLDGSYDLGVAKLFAQYGQVKNTPATDEYKDKIWQLGASVPVGAGAVLASYGEKQYKETGAGNTYKDKSKTLSLGYDYALSKRTDVYAAYAYDRFSDNDPTTAKFESTNSVGVGIRHRF
ncbi:porin [Aquabacterium sp.]|uniref:porin n=1 Tax=Aquabacterium sp. TaxID=1872578 RepID=UPI0035B112D1